MITEIKLHNPGVLMKTLDADVFEDLKKDIEAIVSKKSYILKSQRMNNRLAGHLENSYNYFPKENLKNFLKQYVNEYCDYFDVPSMKQIIQADSWINVQKKYEFNPLHIHDGVLSWVAWINVPYSLEDEDEYSNSKKSNGSCNSRFYFNYNRYTGDVGSKQLDIDKTFEGKIILFPATLYHGVYPFYTSDDLRISVAGNFTRP